MLGTRENELPRCHIKVVGILLGKHGRHEQPCQQNRRAGQCDGAERFVFSCVKFAIQRNNYYCRHTQTYQQDYPFVIRLNPYAMSPENTGSSANRIERETVSNEAATTDRTLRQKEDPNLRSCLDVVGHNIHAIDGEIGHVAALLVDEETWAIRYFVIDTSNGWIGHQVLIAPQWITNVSWENRSVTVGLTRESVRTAPSFDSTRELNRGEEVGLYRHHQRHGYWMDTLKLEREI